MRRDQGGAAICAKPSWNERLLLFGDRPHKTNICKKSHTWLELGVSAFRFRFGSQKRQLCGSFLFYKGRFWFGCHSSEGNLWRRCLDCCCGLINIEITFMRHCFVARRGFPPFQSPWAISLSPLCSPSLTVVDGGGEPALASGGHVRR